MHSPRLKTIMDRYRGTHPPHNVHKSPAITYLIKELTKARSHEQTIVADYEAEFGNHINKFSNEACAHLQNMINRKHTTKKIDKLFIEKYQTEFPSFVNLSSFELSPMETCVLSLGPRFIFKDQHKESDIVTLFEQAYERVKQREGTDAPMLKAMFSAEMQLHLRDNKRNRRSKIIHQLLRRIKTSNVSVTKTDKDSKLVLIDRIEYVAKVKDVLNGTQFSIHNTNEPKKRRGRPPTLPRNIFETKQLEVERFIETVPHLSEHVQTPALCRQAQLYGLIKTHKPGNKIRPVMSATNSYSFHLAKFLAKAVSQHCLSKYCLESTDSFFGKLHEKPPDPNSTLASFDVVSLFTNVPVKRTIGLLLNEMYANTNEYYIDNVRFTRQQMCRALNLAAIDQVFNFDGTTYVQREGCSMGSPLGTHLANFFLSYLENNKIDFGSEYSPIRYYRYIDDTFLEFAKPEHVARFLSHLNELSNLKFTSEEAVDSSLNFIGLSIRNHPALSTTVHRKFEYTVTSALTHCSETTKYSGFTCLVRRALKFTSCWRSSYEEVNKLKQIAIKMGLDIDKINAIIDHRMQTLFSPSKESVEKCYIKLPFVNSQRASSVNNFLKPININVSFISTKSLYATLRVREPALPSSLGESNVVYKYQCGQCASSYVGQTYRLLGKRKAEHSRVTSDLYKMHGAHCENPIRDEDFTVLERCRTSGERLIKESYHIRQQYPDLNTQLARGNNNKRLRLT